MKFQQSKSREHDLGSWTITLHILPPFPTCSLPEGLRELHHCHLALQVFTNWIKRKGSDMTLDVRFDLLVYKLFGFGVILGYRIRNNGVA
jgi:hypothetical protein